MWVRDVTVAGSWAIAKGFSLALMIGALGAMWSAVTGDTEPGHRGPLFVSALILFVGAGWLFQRLTALPLLIWRRRKFHVFRILVDKTSGARAIQIRLFGLWFYVLFDGGDIEPHLSLSGWTDVHPLYCWRSFGEETMEREINDLINKIKPPAPTADGAGTIVYEKYAKKSES